MRTQHPQYPAQPMLLTFAETALELGVSPTTVRRLIKAGKLPVVELDTGTSVKPSRRIRRTDLASYVRDLERA
jgi:excisionase family DNA binding protein